MNFSQNKWKYGTIGLAAILALIITTPQASAHINTNVGHMLQHIYNFVDGIESKTNNLPGDPASNTVVNTRASQASVNDLQSDVDDIADSIASLSGGSSGFQIFRQATGALGGQLPTLYECSSDTDALVHLDYSVASTNGGHVHINVEDGPSWGYDFREDKTITTAALADETWEISVSAFGSGDALFGFIIVEAPQDATVSCTQLA